MRGPLGDIVVLDLSRALAGPHAAQMLGDLGARVIKVEHPDGGDESRGWGPPFVGPDEEISTYFLAANRNKQSIAVDLKSDAGRDLVERLVRRSDVLVENFRTGVLDRLGLPVERLHELNPRLVVLSITGFGHDGPEGGRPGYDQIAQGEAGLMSLTGPPGEPHRVGASVADLLAGIHGAYGVVAALYERERTGRGRVVRTSLLAAVTGVHSYHGTAWTVGGRVPAAGGNHHATIAPYGAFRCADGMLQIAAANDGQWKKVAALLDIDPDMAKYATNRDRFTHRDELIADMEKALAAHDRAHWLARLGEAGVPAGAIRSIDEVYAWEQTRSQGLVVEVDHPVLGPVELPGPPLRFDGLDGVRHTPPPALGQDGDAVLRWLTELEERER
ncbi:CaiB/BaiF CoA transferase family protein [Nonomuraea ceibae]|uniref:CaiB/BaiF CoA transferase family protein n=1 Tax=Nonomuraea ceibae TaxID=1935170 RepID=UPI001C606C91|nr:CoA transferase [Nonomuraea ceibae]